MEICQHLTNTDLSVDIFHRAYMSSIHSQSEQVGDRDAQPDWFQFGPAKSPFEER